MSNNPLLFAIPGIESDELMFVQEVIKELNENQQKQFVLLYQGRRKDPQHMLLFTLLGFVVVAGVQRFVIGQLGMGLLYLFTAGFCFIGTIIDLLNYKKLALTYNQHQAIECKMLAATL